MLLDGFNIVGLLSLRSEDLELDVAADVACNAEAICVDSADENGTLHEEQDHNEVFLNEEETLDAVIDRLLPMEASESDWNHFAMFWIGNPIKFHHSATFHNTEDHPCIDPVSILMFPLPFSKLGYKDSFSRQRAPCLFHFLCSIPAFFLTSIHP